MAALGPAEQPRSEQHRGPPGSGKKAPATETAHVRDGCQWREQRLTPDPAGAPPSPGLCSATALLVQKASAATREQSSEPDRLLFGVSGSSSHRTPELKPSGACAAEAIPSDPTFSLEMETLAFLPIRRAKSDF